MNTIPAPKVDTSSPAYRAMHKQATELEGVFLNTLMKEMFSSIQTSEESFGGGFAEETWRGMQAEQFADAIAARGGVGLADSLMSDLLRLQESAPTVTGV
ncbi:MAG: rod-binding protein [Devosia sp.]